MLAHHNIYTEPGMGSNTQYKYKYDVVEFFKYKYEALKKY